MSKPIAKVPTKCFLKKEIIYVPHLHYPDLYVGPGGTIAGTAQTLLKQSAKPIEKYLYPSPANQPDRQANTANSKNLP